MEERRTVETLVFERESESVYDLRDCRVAIPALVVVVDDLVIVQVLVFNVAGLEWIAGRVDALG